MAVTRRYLDLCLVVLAIQALVGIVGFWFHLQMNFYTPGTSLFEKSVYGAPPMAPLLFPNLVVLALIGLWELAAHLPEASSDSQSIFGKLHSSLESAAHFASETESAAPASGLE